MAMHSNLPEVSDAFSATTLLSSPPVVPNILPAPHQLPLPLASKCNPTITSDKLPASSETSAGTLAPPMTDDSLASASIASGNPPMLFDTNDYAPQPSAVNNEPPPPPTAINMALLHLECPLTASADPLPPPGPSSMTLLSFDSASASALYVVLMSEGGRQTSEANKGVASSAELLL